MTEFLSLLEHNFVLLVISCAALGCIVGSFLNVVIHRLPVMFERAYELDYQQWQADKAAEASGQEPTLITQPAPYNLITPNSNCPHCGYQIKAWQNIPILSYLLLGGKCKGCRQAISIRYPLVELSTGLLCAFAAYHFGFGIQLLASLVFIWVLIALTGIDLDTQYLPDDLTLPLLWLGLLLNINGTFTSLGSAVIGAAAGYLSLWTVYWCFKLLTGKEGMGYGDFKLLAALGAWFGWVMLPLIILASSLVGAIVGISLIVFAGHKRSVPIPFGPYLAGGGLIALFWGHELTQQFLRL